MAPSFFDSAASGCLSPEFLALSTKFWDKPVNGEYMPALFYLSALRLVSYLFA